MKSITVSKNEAGQRLDKLLHKVLRTAPTSFLYKMLRKKNIVLNGKKAEGSELLTEGDEVTLFLSEETYRNFGGGTALAAEFLPKTKNGKLTVLYEDENVVLINKPAGVLSQKSKPEDYSLNDMLMEYLLSTSAITKEQLLTFRPSICNRLDRNTSGIVIAGKSLSGLQTASELLADRTLRKYYLCIVAGEMIKSERLEGYLIKNDKTNQVTVTKEQEGERIVTEYRPLKAGKNCTLLEVELITGKTHQIRAHLASIGHPIAGDLKYGNNAWNEQLRMNCKIRRQMLHCYHLVFPIVEGACSALSEREFFAELPEDFRHAERILLLAQTR